MVRRERRPDDFTTDAMSVDMSCRTACWMTGGDRASRCFEPYTLLMLVAATLCLEWLLDRRRTHLDNAEMNLDLLSKSPTYLERFPCSIKRSRPL